MYQDMLQLKETHVKVEGLRKTYRFLHITDAHLVLLDEKVSKERVEYETPRIGLFSRAGVRSDEFFNALFSYADSYSDPEDPQALDGVLLTGDILDCPTEENLRRLGKKLAQLKIPYVYVLGNHDWSHFNDYHTPYAMIAHRPVFSKWSNGNTFIHKQKIGEITFVALDDTLDCYEDGVAETLKEVLEGEENVFIMQHIPLYADTLHEDTVAYWKSDLNLGGKGVCVNDNWKKVQDLILEENSPVKGLITGHLHFWHEDLIGGKVPQYITALSAEGNARIFVMEADTV